MSAPSLLSFESESADGCSYSINEADCLIHLSESWFEFADRNGGAHLTRPSVLGRSLHSFLAGDTVGATYRRIFECVRTRHRGLRFPFRCDAPHLRRYMEMHIHPLLAGGLLFRTQLLWEEERPAVSWHDRAAVRGSLRHPCCSLCSRLALPEERWAEVEEVLLGLPELPSADHVVCRHCDEFLRISLLDHESGHSHVRPASRDVGRAASLTIQEPVEPARPQQKAPSPTGHGVEEFLDETKRTIEESRRVLDEMRAARADALRASEAAHDVLRRAWEDLRKAPIPIKPEDLPRPPDKA